MTALNAGTKPETLEQARRFERVRRFYVDHGLCTRCAAQAAFGHQNGFTGLREPCAPCQPIVDTFPLKAVVPWRKYRPFEGRQGSAPSPYTTLTAGGLSSGALLTKEDVND